MNNTIRLLKGEVELTKREFVNGSEYDLAEEEQQNEINRQ